ncbi:MAG TPA: RNA 2',3'-cyclic phosphodiesterase, partial [Planctomycetota bacterium]|nr:RNA 2',3'-cyclic phosphodiesterase [Planctomycetota bacterium]
MGIRAFIAVEIPDDIKEALGRLQARLRSAEVKVRWVDHRNIHLTTKFLGDVGDADVPKICEVIQRSAAGTPAIELEVAGLGTFPPNGPPRIIWVGIRGALEPLAAFVADVEQGLADEVGIRPEHRKFHPHLTLGRVKSTRSLEPLVGLMRQCESADLGTFTAEGVTLFMSELDPKGAIHTPMAQMKFEG